MKNKVIASILGILAFCACQPNDLVTDAMNDADAADIGGDVNKPNVPLTFISSGYNSIGLKKHLNPHFLVYLDYKLNNGKWNLYEIGDLIHLNDGDRVSFQARGSGNKAFNGIGVNGKGGYYSFSISGDGTVAASGNIMSLVNQTMETLEIPDDFYFSKLFYNCKGLTSAPELPATTLTWACYQDMFYGCTSLTKAPELPATTLTWGCYREMFYGCTSLTTAPELPATTLADYCYQEMFNGCRNLNYVKALFTTIPEKKSTLMWLNGVSGKGTFVKSKDADWNVTGPSGIPNGWTVTTE